ncbi:sulfate transporter family protein [Terrihabitans rhizophilus]|uniref:Sulfate transporter family protein n=1 Tax=Terrihabitans rhizophilus TaxID=3092662 RepID=A0ABU4RJJ5_9HYPH|nr:sulfate transporter family protein [Terrihabitans sp. PJ23]MDX6805019.1 sulfate transporter family protein [Terrihabitans sp. PJ23]
MIQAALLALSQAFSPAFRSILLKTVGLALLFLVVLGVLLWTLATHFIDLQNQNFDLAAGVLSGLGIVAGLFFLIPPVVSLVAGFYQDRIAERVEADHYPADVPGRELPTGRSILLAIRFALLVLVVNVGTLFLLLVPGVNLIVWWIANGYLLGREYFEFAAMRFLPEDEAKALRSAYTGRVFIGGLMIAALMAVPILNLTTPLVASAFMVHVFKRVQKRLPPPRV